MNRTLAAVIAVTAIAAPAIADQAAPPAAERRANPQGGASAVAPVAGFAPRQPPPPVPTPKPTLAPEIAITGKAMAGSWTCKGNTLRADGSSAPLTAAVTTKLDLDRSWIVTSLVEKGGALKWTEYRTYDGVAKQWTRIQMASTSGHVISTSPGEQTGTWTWTGTATSPNGSAQLRDYEQQGGKARKLWGEVQVGTTWQKLYEVTCKR